MMIGYVDVQSPFLEGRYSLSRAEIPSSNRSDDVFVQVLMTVTPCFPFRAFFVPLPSDVELLQSPHCHCCDSRPSRASMDGQFGQALPVGALIPIDASTSHYHFRCRPVSEVDEESSGARPGSGS